MRAVHRVGLIMLAVIALAAAIPLLVFRGSPSRVIANARTSIAEVAEFDRVYPGSDHFISYFTGTHGPTTWNSRVGIGGRYVLTMQAPIHLNLFKTRVVGFGPATYSLSEVSRVEQLEDGRIKIFHGPLDLHFDPARWGTLADSKGDLTSLGVPIQMDQPVPDFDRAIREY